MNPEKDWNHEQILSKNHIPALIAILDKEEIDKVMPMQKFIPLHWHRSIEISLIENAEAILQIGTKKTIVKNDFTCINSSVLHSISGHSLNNQTHCIILVLSYDFIKTYYPDIDHVTFDLSLKQDHSDLKALFYRLKTLYLNQDEYTYLQINACLLDILHLMLSQYQKPKVQSDKDKFILIKDVLSYLHQHYQEDLTLEDMAKHFHMSKEHFSRQFHQYVRETYIHYLKAYRLYQAYDDVVHSHKTIQDIARIHGFLNVKSFINAFTREYHQTPLQYRKNHKVL